MFWAEPLGAFGYLRIYTFDVDDADELVDKITEAIRKLPQKGLIIDVRENPGGRSRAAERLLQVISPSSGAPDRARATVFREYPAHPAAVPSCRRTTGPRPEGGRALDQVDSACHADRRALFGKLSVYRSAEDCNVKDRAALSRSCRRDHGCADAQRRLRFSPPASRITAGRSWAFTRPRAALARTPGSTVSSPNISGRQGNLRSSSCRKEPTSCVAFRRFERVGRGGRQRDRRLRRNERLLPRTTRADLLNNNVDLIKRAIELLKGKRRRPRSSSGDRDPRKRSGHARETAPG